MASLPPVISKSVEQTSQPELPQPGPIHLIPDELLRSILFVTELDDKPSIRSVCRHWKVQTLIANTEPHQRDLQQLIQLLSENLKRYPECLTDLKIILSTFKFLLRDLVTPEQAQRLFRATKICIVDVLKKVAPEERILLLKNIGDKIPYSMRSLFGIVDLTIGDTISTGEFGEFPTLPLTYLSSNDKTAKIGEEAMVLAAEKGNLQMLYMLLTYGFVKNIGLAVYVAAEYNHRACLVSLLDHGSITSFQRGGAVCEAAKNNNLELVQLLLDNGSIDSDDNFRGTALIEAVRHDNVNLELVRLLLKGPINRMSRVLAIVEAKAHNNAELEQLLQDNRPISSDELGKALVDGVIRNDLMAIQTILSIGGIPIADRMKALRLARLKEGPNRDPFIQLLEREPIRADKRATSSCSVQ